MKISYFQIAAIIFLSQLSMQGLAQPPGSVEGKLVFLGVTHNSSQSVWLSLTTAGSFDLEAQGNQVVDTWDMSSRGAHLSLSPFVSQGNGGTHHLINRLNNKKLDSQNQSGGIVIPPLPALPPSIMPPIYIPPVVPAHPIVIPPGVPTHPIVKPPGTPTHPIVNPPETSPSGNQPNPPGNPPSTSPTRLPASNITPRSQGVTYRRGTPGNEPPTTTNAPTKTNTPTPTNVPTPPNASSNVPNPGPSGQLGVSPTLSTASRSSVVDVLTRSPTITNQMISPENSIVLAQNKSSLPYPVKSKLEQATVDTSETLLGETNRIQPISQRSIVIAPHSNQSHRPTLKPKMRKKRLVSTRRKRAVSVESKNTDYFTQRAPITEARQFDRQQTWNI